MCASWLHSKTPRHTAAWEQQSASRGANDQPARATYYIIAAFCVIGWLYVLFISDLFQINTVETEGLQHLDAVDVSREVFAFLDQRKDWKPWPARHAWFVDVPALEADLKTQLFAEHVTVDKTYTHILRLKIQERANRFIFHSHQQYVWVDLQGLVTAELTPDERRSVQSRLLGQRVPSPDESPVIQNDLDELITVGYRVAEPMDVRTWIEKTAEIVKAGVAYRELRLPHDDSATAAMISPDGYDVLLDISKPLDAQLQTYEAFKRARTNYKVSEYLDVRIPGRVYYK